MSKRALIIILTLISACSQQKLVHPTLSYTTTNSSFEQLNQIYKTVPINRSPDLSAFIQKAELIEENDRIKRLNLNGTVKTQVFINEKGSIESIFIVNPLHPYLDSLCTATLKKFEFKPNFKVRNSPKYSCLVEFIFFQGGVYPPWINGRYTESFSPESKTFLKQNPSDGIFDFMEVDTKPEIIYPQVPIYPDLARKAGIQGSMVVTIIIDEEGKVIDTSIFKSIPELNDASIVAAKKCRFKPARHTGKPVKVRMNIPFQFRLR